jgi:transcriptional regulator with XRE-family HTH domain
MSEKILQEARLKFGLLFKELREKKGFTQQQVGDFCGVTLHTINKVEQGKFPYSIDLLMKLSVVLGFTINLEIKEIVESRFLLQESEKQNYYTLTDTENQIVCLFEKGKFNETQKFSFLKDGNFNAANLATIMREFGDWLQVNHSSIV